MEAVQAMEAAMEAVQVMEAVAVRPLMPQRLLRPWRPKNKKSYLEVEF